MKISYDTWRDDFMKTVRVYARENSSGHANGLTKEDIDREVEHMCKYHYEKYLRRENEKAIV